MGHSSSKCFNALQCVIGFFLESKCTPEGVIKLLAHIGVSVSTQTTCNMINSLTKSAAHRNNDLLPSMIVYDNFDINFKVAQPTVGKAGLHTSMTSATFAPYAHGFMWSSWRNCMWLPSSTRTYWKHSLLIYTPCIWVILPPCELLVDSLDSLHKAFAWHFWAILLWQD